MRPPKGRAKGSVVILFHGTDTRAAEAIQAEGLRAGAHVTDDLRAAEHYARRSAGVRAEMMGGRREGAIVVLDAMPVFLTGGGIDPNSPWCSTWQLRRTERPIEVLIAPVPKPNNEERIWHREVEQHRWGGRSVA
jgi:hypothetical protein